MPLSYYFFVYILNSIMTTAVRFSYRILCSYIHWHRLGFGNDVDRIMIIGAVSAGQILRKEIHNSSICLLAKELALMRNGIL